MSKQQRTWTKTESEFFWMRGEAQREATDRAILAGIEATQRGEDPGAAIEATRPISEAQWQEKAAAWNAGRGTAGGDTSDPATLEPPADDECDRLRDLEARLQPTRLRVAGWSTAKQRAFIVALAETGCVSHAAAAVGRSRQSAYALRNRAPRSIFALAWDVAIDLGRKRLLDIALEHAIEGREVAVWYRGEQVGTRRVFNDRLIAFLLAHKRAPAHPALTDYEAAGSLPQLLARIDAVLPDPITVHAAAQAALLASADETGGRTRSRWGDLFPQPDALFPPLDD
ncbi:hypothetical protein D9601_08735 [Sphingomonas sp. MA1305]|uniref:hypothetical protein n=1 Tax=Sphingomonas sp. MA1305 TaxID=2479204 RepID=UPI0018DFA1BF|nr:hypothetical protein [Sphingomonas sp. MA1305]MBI0475434.1 hypothetical protein [Sphingomonas sp. MA1305]